MASHSLCSIPNCDKPSRHRDWCSAHYQRWLKYGDPLLGGPSRNRQDSICQVKDCGRRTRCRNLCGMHYQRWKKHGDPLFGRGKVANGEALRYFREVVLQYEGDECLTWPFTTNNSGYAVLRFDGKQRSASRVVCEEVNGPPPTDCHESAHSCGKGHMGCVNPNHISWKTPVENAADRHLHGTHIQGERSGISKLTESDVRDIRSSGERSCDLADRYSVSRSLITLVRKRIVWAWLE